MNNITDIEKNLPHKITEVICINCKYRFISVRPVKTSTRELECPKCKEVGSVIDTGEDLEVADLST